jgi:hypothetical protein
VAKVSICLKGSINGETHRSCTIRQATMIHFDGKIIYFTLRPFMLLTMSYSLRRSDES